MESNLDAYLAQIEAQLTDIPATSRAAHLDEVRAHLLAMCEAKRADGLDANAAWLQAAAEFGEPAQVGRALREQWASSGQLETEGEPLSKREKARMIGGRLAAIAVIITLAVFLPESAQEKFHEPQIYALFMLGLAGFWAFRFRREGRQWTASSIMAYAMTFLILMLPTAQLQWPEIRIGDSLATAVLGMSLLTAWLAKRERANRPWQWSARFKSSPVAAEQEYRFNRILSLALGTTMGCASLIAGGLQFFGLPIALLGCAGVIGAAVVYWRWLVK